MVFPVVVVAQRPATTTTNDTPLKAVQLFKSALDANNVERICGYLTEEDGSGPLKRIHYEKTQRSLEGLIAMWQGRTFQYGTTTYSKNDTRATVNVEVPSLSQSVQFILLKFGNRWYVFDMEIYFKE
jgi:hypothetical protein